MRFLIFFAAPGLSTRKVDLLGSAHYFSPTRTDCRAANKWSSPLFVLDRLLRRKP